MSDRSFSRRQALGAIAAGAVIPTAAGVLPLASKAVTSTELDPIDRVRINAEALADSLKAIHGGTWSIQISHKSGFVAVSKDFG